MSFRRRHEGRRARLVRLPEWLHGHHHPGPEVSDRSAPGERLVGPAKKPERAEAVERDAEACAAEDGSVLDWVVIGSSYGCAVRVSGLV